MERGQVDSFARLDLQVAAQQFQPGVAFREQCGGSAHIARVLVMHHRALAGWIVEQAFRNA